MFLRRFADASVKDQDELAAIIEHYVAVEERAGVERLKAAEADAARYQWLRDYAGVFYNDVFNDILHFDTVEEDAANLDSAIDRAMGSTTSGGEPHE